MLEKTKEINEIELCFTAKRNEGSVTVEVYKIGFAFRLSTINFFSLEECEYVAENGSGEILKEAAITAMQIW